MKEMTQKEKFKTIRDRIVPILINQARLEMMRMYKPGLVEPLGEGTVGIIMSTEPIRSLAGPLIQKDFYACYKMVISLKPVIQVKDPSCRELLQDHVQTKIHTSNLNFEDVDGKDHTLIMYMIDFYVTGDGEVWHEQAGDLWRKVLELPPGLLQVSLLNLRANFNVKYVV